MVVLRYFVAVRPAQTPRRVRAQRRRWLSTCVRPTGNVAVSGLVVAQHVSTWRVERTFDRGEGRMEGSLEVTLEDP